MTKRRKKLIRLKEKKRKNKFPLWKLATSFLLAISAIIYLWVTSGFFRSSTKPTFVVNDENGAIVSVFDKQQGTITDIVIPGNTQVNVSRQLGTWKLASVWKLGENEKLEGVLLTETIIKNFKIPVNAWRDHLSGRTNLGVGDRLLFWFFSLGASSGDKREIDLANQNFLKKTRLWSREEGYLVSDSPPPYLSSPL